VPQCHGGAHRRLLPHLCMTLLGFGAGTGAGYLGALNNVPIMTVGPTTLMHILCIMIGGLLGSTQRSATCALLAVACRQRGAWLQPLVDCLPHQVRKSLLQTGQTRSASIADRTGDGCVSELDQLSQAPRVTWPRRRLGLSIVVCTVSEGG
jgi:hypothetical protein